jgi:hypothetical protein
VRPGGVVVLQPWSECLGALVVAGVGLSVGLRLRSGPVISIDFTPVVSDPAWGASWVPVGPPDHKPVAGIDLTKYDFIFDYFRSTSRFRSGTSTSASRPATWLRSTSSSCSSSSGDAPGEKRGFADLSDRQGEWCFSRDSDGISLYARYAAKDGWHRRPATGRCGLSEFEQAVDASLHDALELIFTRQPLARQNPYLDGLSHGGFAPA